eukprot:9064097-Pyramimonas_sp.AAC.1
MEGNQPFKCEVKKYMPNRGKQHTSLTLGPLIRASGCQWGRLLGLRQVVFLAQARACTLTARLSSPGHGRGDSWLRNC